MLSLGRELLVLATEELELPLELLEDGPGCPWLVWYLLLGWLLVGGLGLFLEELLYILATLTGLVIIYGLVKRPKL